MDQGKLYEGVDGETEILMTKCKDREKFVSEWRNEQYNKRDTIPKTNYFPYDIVKTEDEKFVSKTLDQNELYYLKEDQPTNRSTTIPRQRNYNY